MGFPIFSNGSILFRNGAFATSADCCCNPVFCYPSQVSAYVGTLDKTLEEVQAVFDDMSWVLSEWHINFAGIVSDGEPTVGDTYVVMNAVTCRINSMDQQDADMAAAIATFFSDNFGPGEPQGTCQLATTSTSIAGYWARFQGVCVGGQMYPQFITKIYSPLRCLCDAEGNPILDG